MTRPQDPREAALAAYWAFIDGFNSRSPERWSDGLNFPHVRVPGRNPVRIVATREEHDSGMTWAPVIATGWDHSVGAEPEVLHVSPDVVHIRGGWTRYDKAGQPILVNQVTYIVTRMMIGGREHNRADYENLHRNKESLTLNMKAPQGLEILHALVRKADGALYAAKASGRGRYVLAVEPRPA